MYALLPFGNPIHSWIYCICAAKRWCIINERLINVYLILEPLHDFNAQTSITDAVVSPV